MNKHRWMIYKAWASGTRNRATAKGNKRVIGRVESGMVKSGAWGMKALIMAAIMALTLITSVFVYTPELSEASPPLGVSSITANPMYFSPNGDGTQDNTIINVSASSGQSLWVNIYENSTGLRVKTMALAESGAGSGYYECVWNGTDNSNTTIVDDGLYDIYVSTSEDGNRSNESALHTMVIVDTTWPELQSIEIVCNATGERDVLKSDADYTIIAGFYENGSGLNATATELNGPFVSAPLMPDYINATHAVWYAHTTAFTEAQPVTLKVYIEDKAGNKILPSWGQWASDKYKWLTSIGDDSPPNIANGTVVKCYSNAYYHEFSWENVTTRVVDPPKWSNTYTYSLPWNFTYFGMEYNTIYIDLYGYVGIGTSYVNDPSPTWGEFTSRRVISPLWFPFMADAWDEFGNDIGDGDLGVYVENKSNPERVVVRWYVNDAYDPLYFADFEAVLYRDGRIQFNYGDIDTNITKWGGIAGISNGTGSEVYAVQWSPHTSVTLHPGTLPGPVWVTYPSNQTSVMNGESINISAIIVDNISGLRYGEVVLQNGTHYPMEHYNDLYWSVVPIYGLDDGVYNLSLYVEDWVGNNVTLENISSFVVDNYHDLVMGANDTFTEGGYYKPGTYTLTLPITNNGTIMEGEYNLSVRVMNASAIVYSNYTDASDLGAIMPGETINAVFSNITLTSNDTYTLLMNLSCAGDEDTGNNNESVNFTIDGLLPSIADMGIYAFAYGAWINITTDEPTLCTIAYGPKGAITFMVEDGAYSTHHNISLTNLSSGVTYYFYVICRDRANNTLVDNNTGMYYNFTTVDVIPPLIFNLSAQVIKGTAYITWSTDEPARALVYYGVERDNITSLAVNDTLTQYHNVTITNLSSSTIYYYYIVSTDIYNNTAVDNNSGDYYTLVVRDYLPPELKSMAIYPFHNGTSVAINISADEACSVRICYGDRADNLTQWENETFCALYHNITLSQLQPDRDYYFIAILTDAWGNSATADDNGSPFVFHTYDTIPPVISDVGVSVHTDDGIYAKVTWLTDEPAISVVHYSTDALELFQGNGMEVGEDSMAISHTVVIPDLEPQMTYYFYIECTDENGNVGIDNNDTYLYHLTTPDITPIQISSKWPLADVVNISEGDVMRFSVNLTGVEDNPVVYTWFINGFYVGNESGLVFAPTYTQAGTYTIKVTVEEVSQPPSWNQTEWRVYVGDKLPGPKVMGYYPETHNIQMYEGEGLIFGIEPHIDYGTWAVSWYMDGEAVMENTTLLNYTFNTDYNSSGQYHICAVVYGNGMSTAVNWYLKVINVNRMPIITSHEPTNANITVAEGEVLRFEVTASDPDGDTITYLWYLDDSPPVIEHNGLYVLNTTSATSSTSTNTTHTLVVYVSDGLVQSPIKVRIWNITVLKPPAKAEITAFDFNPSSVGVGDSVVFTLVYLDANNVPPESIVLVINGQAYSMQESDPEDRDVRDGKMYYVSVKIDGAIENLVVQYRVDGERMSYIPTSFPEVVSVSTAQSGEEGKGDEGWSRDITFWYGVGVSLVLAIFALLLLRQRQGFKGGREKGRREKGERVKSSGEDGIDTLTRIIEAQAKSGVEGGGGSGVRDVVAGGVGVGADTGEGGAMYDEAGETEGEGGEGVKAVVGGLGKVEKGISCLGCAYQYDVEEMSESRGKKTITLIKMCGYWQRPLEDYNACEHFVRYDEIREGVSGEMGVGDGDERDTCLGCRHFRYDLNINPETKEISRIPICNLTGKDVVLKNLQICAEYTPLKRVEMERDSDTFEDLKFEVGEYVDKSEI